MDQTSPDSVVEELFGRSRGEHVVGRAWPLAALRAPAPRRWSLTCRSADYACAYHGGALLRHGRLYLTTRRLCFYSTALSETKVRRCGTALEAAILTRCARLPTAHSPACGRQARHQAARPGVHPNADAAHARRLAAPVFLVLGGRPGRVLRGHPAAGAEQRRRAAPERCRAIHAHRCSHRVPYSGRTARRNPNAGGRSTASRSADDRCAIGGAGAERAGRGGGRGS